jgi:2-haloacid dehalogenase
VRPVEYTWLRTITRTYADFWTVTQDALDFAAQKAGLELAAAGRERLMAAWLELKAWKEARAVLRELKGRGLRLVLLSDAAPYHARLLGGELWPAWRFRPSREH